MGTSLSQLAPTTATNAYGLTPSTLALMSGLQGMSNTLQGAGAGQQQRGGLGYPPMPGSAWSPGQTSAEQLLATILAMRQQAALGIGAPFQTGVAMPRVSLLSG